MSVDRLITYATLREHTSRSYSVDLRHVARMADGREILLLDDRGFSASSTYPDIRIGREQLERDARNCVGPDEPAREQTREHVETSHWTFIADRLRTADVAISVDELRGLEHDVVLDQQLEALVE